MYLQQRTNMFFPAQFTGKVAGAADSPLLGTTQRMQIDRQWPIEEIRLHVNFTVNATLTLANAAPQTPDALDSVMSLLQHVNLTVNDGKQPRSVVDCSGVALIHYQLRTGGALDRGTSQVVARSAGATLPAGNYTMLYRIPMVDNRVAEPLRSRLYLPVHTYPQDPVLTLQFQNAATMYSAGNINYVGVEVQLIRRQVTAQSEAVLQKFAGTNPNGYIDQDLIETPFAIPVGSGAEIRIALPIPGQYGTLQMRHYLGGANVGYGEIDNGATGSSFGSENRWRLESGLVVVREWRWKHLRADVEQNGNIEAVVNQAGFIAAASGGAVTTALASPAIGSPGSTSLPSGQFFYYANSALLDFYTDGATEDVATELGSLLDCNTPANNGLKMEIVGSPASVATNSSYLYIMGRRLFGDLSKYQLFA